MFGVQWDLVLKYIESKNATTQTNLKTDSKIIGNYSENLWNITNANAKYSTDRDWIYNRQLNKTLVLISEEQCFIKEHLIEYLSNTDYNKAENGNWIITDIKKEQ